MVMIRLILQLLLLIAPVLPLIGILLWLGAIGKRARRLHDELLSSAPPSARSKIPAAKIAQDRPDIAALWFSDGTRPLQTDPLKPSRHSVPVINPATGLPMVNGIGSVDVTGSPFGFDTRPTSNPANGLPMINGPSGVDVAGNPYGTDMNSSHCFGHNGLL